jgi:molybdenum cofactor biosynthesis enzyme MoaA
MTMKTLIIYNEVPEGGPKFLIIEGDYSRFNGVAFNMGYDHEFGIECNEWLFTHDGSLKHIFSEDVAVIESKDFDRVALITFLI